MREIKFRAWDNDAQCMIYSDSNKIETADYWWEFDPVRVGCITGESGGNNFEPPEPIVTYYEVIMQFTGLKDKNGKEIYEGDILHSNKSDIYLYGNNSPVDFESGAFCVTILYDQIQEPLWGFDRVYKPTDYPNNTEKYEWIEEFEVIGNIYENPELLK